MDIVRPVLEMEFDSSGGKERLSVHQPFIFIQLKRLSGEVFSIQMELLMLLGIRGFPCFINDCCNSSAETFIFVVLHRSMGFTGRTIPCAPTMAG